MSTYYKHSKHSTEEEPECLILTLPHSTGQKELLLIPIGSIDGCILYLESHDLPEPQASIQAPEPASKRLEVSKGHRGA